MIGILLWITKQEKIENMNNNDEKVSVMEITALFDAADKICVESYEDIMSKAKIYHINVFGYGSNDYHLIFENLRTYLNSNIGKSGINTVSHMGRTHFKYSFKEKVEQYVISQLSQLS
jgi:hypothetical protein